MMYKLYCDRCGKYLQGYSLSPNSKVFCNTCAVRKIKLRENMNEIFGKSVKELRDEIKKS